MAVQGSADLGKILGAWRAHVRSIAIYTGGSGVGSRDRVSRSRAGLRNTKRLSRSATTTLLAYQARIEMAPSANRRCRFEICAAVFVFVEGTFISVHVNCCVKCALRRSVG